MIHFDRLILNLRHAGMSNGEVARRMGVSKSAVEKWVQGVRRPERWIELLDLHYDHCPQRHSVDVIGAP